MPLCLAVTGVTVAMLATDALSLIWARSVEKTEWREEWRVDGDRLTLVSATIGGSGAGIDPPANAMPAGNGWRYVPSVAHVPVLRLSLSPFAGDYGLCWHHDCRMLAEMLPAGTADPLELSACRP
jgi:hypothetical protein